MKLTKEKLKQIIKEELQDMSEEIDGKFKLVHKPSSPGQHGCKEDYLYDEDLHLCIREDITAQRLREEPALGVQLNREVKQLRGW